MQNGSRRHLLLPLFIAVWCWLGPAHPASAQATAADSGRIDRFSTEQGLPSRFPRPLIRTSERVIMAAFMAAIGVNVWEGPGELYLPSGSGKRFSSQGLRSPHIMQFLQSGGNLYAATEKGLHVLASESWRPLGPPVFWHLVIEGPGQSVWIAGCDESEHLTVGRVVDHDIRLYGSSVRGRDLLGLFPTSTTSALLVTGTGIWRTGRKNLQEVPLQGTPIWAPSPRSVERRMPPVYLHDCCRNQSGDLFLIGHFKKLVRCRLDSLSSPESSATTKARKTSHRPAFEVLGKGHFRSVTPVPGSDTVIISDFSGMLYRYDGRSFCSWKRFPDAQIGKMCVDELSRIWVELAPGKQQPHQLHLYATATEAHPVRVWSLGHSDGFLSPGLLEFLPDPGTISNPGLWASTNEGLWHFIP